MDGLIIGVVLAIILFVAFLMDGLISGVVLVITLFVAFVIEKKPWGWKGYEIIASWREQGLQGISAFWARITDLKKLYVFFASIIGFALLVLFVLLYSQIILIPFDLSKLDDINTNFALAFVGTVSSFGALFGVYIALIKAQAVEVQSQAEKDQADIAKEEQIDDKITAANANLGKNDEQSNPLIELRYGAIYAMEEIIKKNPVVHIRIIDTLCTYIRTNSKLKSKSTKEQILREDIQVALTVIGRRGAGAGGDERLKIERDERYRMDLQGCDLRGALFSRANLRGARFLDSNMSRVTFDNADLSNVWFEDTILNGTWFGNAKMDRVWAWECDFSKCRELTQKQLDVMYCGKDVKIPDGLTRPKHWPKDKLPLDKFQDGYFEWETAQPDSYLKPQDTKAPAT